jgi:hypothetical protein
MRQRFDTARACARLEPLGIRPAPLPAYFDRLVAFALDADWGKREVPRRAAARELALAS